MSDLYMTLNPRPRHREGRAAAGARLSTHDDQAVISPDGKLVLAPYDDEVWRVFDLRRPAVAPVTVRDAKHERMRFDQSARYVLGTDTRVYPQRKRLAARASRPAPRPAAGAEVTAALFVE